MNSSSSPESSRQRNRIVSFTKLVFVTLAVVGMLAGCATTSEFSDSSIGTQIDSALKPHERAGETSINLGTVVSGDWEKVLVVCRGTTRDQIESALGFKWDGPDVRAGGFLAMLVFYGRHHVVKYFSAGQDDAIVDHWYFTPCSLTKVPIDTGPISLARTDSVIKFTLNKSLGSKHLYFWFVTTTELAALNTRHD